MYATMAEAYAARRAEEAQRITESVTERVTKRVTESITKNVTIGLLTDYVRGRYGDAAGEVVAAFLADWQDSRLPTHLEMDELVALHQDGQDLQAWWAERRRSELSNGKTNGSSPTPSPN